ncbi:ciliary microtubule inner protein 6 [Microcaecilia unicolor]|uniref:Uncharacterized protein C2orf73 homolog n=1 Tax=Microcaecilia unicolor TaxID=1415580 RepID=A0A6P7XAW2_9AMPH|nr:uncharacterized protein C2orf73 homolog [Microcaecilia unicolor]
MAICAKTSTEAIRAETSRACSIDKQQSHVNHIIVVLVSSAVHWQHSDVLWSGDGFMCAVVVAAPCTLSPNTFRIFHAKVSDVNLGMQWYGPLHPWEKKEPPVHPRSPNRHNVPHPYYAKFIENNSKFFNEPICHVETADTMNKQAVWWKNKVPSPTLYFPPYDMQSTQRRDFQESACIMSPISRHSMNPNKFPVHGIVPLAVPKTKSTVPKIIQEQMSFQHQLDCRKSPAEPIRGKRHGAFVWTEIKPVSEPIVPKGIKAFQSATGSHPPEQPKTGKGNSVKSKMTSPNLCFQNSQQMCDFKSHLSKTDLREAAKAYPRIPASEQNSSSTSQTAEEDTGHLAGVESSCYAMSNPLGKSEGRLLPKSMILPASTALDMEPSLFPCINNTKHKLTPVNC